jgi:hypothetical protein
MSTNAKEWEKDVKIFLLWKIIVNTKKA